VISYIYFFQFDAWASVMTCNMQKVTLH